MTRGVPDTSRSVSRENRTITRNIPSIYRKQSTSIRHGPQAGNTHITDAAQAGISPFDVLSAGMLKWWNIYIAGPWDRRKTEKEIEDFATILEGFQRIILGEKFVAEEVIEGVTYEEGSTVPKPSPETFTEDTLNAINTEPRTWQDLIQEILAILPEEFWVGLDYFANAVHTLIDNLSNTIATASGRIERGDGDWGNSAQRFFFGEKTTQVIRYGEDDTAGSFASGTLLDWVLTEPERSELTSDNTVARDFFEFLTSIGLDALGKFLKPIWEAIKDFGDSVISGIANAIAAVGAWWESLGESVADAIKLVGEWWEGLDQTIRDGIKTAVEWVTDAVGKIREILEDLSKGFWKGVDNFTDAVEETVEDVWTWLNDVGAEIQKTLNSWGTTVWENLNNFGNAAKKAIDAAYTWLSTAYNNGIRWLVGLGGTVQSAITSAANYLTSSIRTGISNAVNWVGSAVGNITSVINSWWADINLAGRISDALGDSWDAITKWWADVPFHRGGTNYIDGLQRVLYGEIFTQFVRVDNRFVARPNDVVTSTNQSYAVGWENLATRNTRARTFAEYLTANIDSLLTTANDVVTGVAAGIRGFFTDISKVLFGGSIIPAAYASTGDDTPETFVDDRNKHWFATLLDQLNPGNLLDEAVNGIQDFIDGIVDWFTGGSDIMGANVNLSNLGNSVKINKPLNFDSLDQSTPAKPALNTAGGDGTLSIGYAPRQVFRNTYYDLWLKTTGGGKMFFNPGTGSNRSTEFSFGKIKINAQTNNPAIGEFSRTADTLKAGVRRDGVTKVVDLFDVGTGSGETPEPEPTIVLNIDSISDRSVKVGERLSSINADASNYNGSRVLEWSKDNTWPSWASINSRTGQILFVNPALVSSIGRHNLRVKVEETNVPSSETALSDTESFLITVNAADAVTPKPDIISINNLTSRVGDPAETHQARLSNSATAGAVRWSKTTSSPSWFRISQDGLISLHPDSTVTPDFYNGTIIATNSAGSDNHIISVRVTKHVSIASGSNVSLKQGESRSQTLRGDDGNNDDNGVTPSYTLSVSGPTQSASTRFITNVGARININPPDDATLGDYAVTFKYTAAGGSESASTTFKITVNQKDRVIVYPTPTQIETNTYVFLSGNNFRGGFGSSTGAIGGVINSGRGYLVVAGYNHWHLFQLNYVDRTSYSLGGISSNKYVRRIAVQNYTKSAVGGGDGRLVIETDNLNDGANFGVRLGDGIILTATNTRVADSSINIDSNGGTFSITVGILPSADVNGQALDELFGREDGSIGYNQSDLSIYLKMGSSWYSLGLPADGLRALS